MRFTGLAQAVSDVHQGDQQLPLDVDLSRGMGLVTYARRLSKDRVIGWQFQEAQLRLFVLVQDEGLVGKGSRLASLPARRQQRRSTPASPASC